LDGRDKITKVLQYASRLLGYYYDTKAMTKSVAAATTTAASSGSTSTNTNVCVTSAASAAAFYAYKAKRFRNLYKALATSRKAFRFGRAVVELEKLKNMGLIHWIAWYMRTAMFKRSIIKIISKSNSKSNNDRDSEFKQVENDDASLSSSSSSSSSSLQPSSPIESQRPVPRRVPFPSREDSTVTFHPDTNFEQQQQPTMKKLNHNNGSSGNGTLEQQQLSQPPPKLCVPSQISADAGWSWDSACFPYSDDDYNLLNRKISSNMDWNLQENEKQKRRRRKYSTYILSPTINTAKSATDMDQLSYLGKIIYQSLSSFIDEDKLHVEGPNDKQKEDQQISPPPPPLWKLTFSAMKLMGLAGFWTGDNLAYLYSIGFLDGCGGKGGGSNGSSSSDNEKKRKMKQTNASLFATRSYFFAAVTGLYLSTREFIQHRNGELVETIDKVKKLRRELKLGSDDSKDNEDDDGGDLNGDGDGVGDGNKAYIEHQRQRELEKLEANLEDMKQKHFKNCLALLKSCCDVIVFSNNAGVDLHLKYRGRKMNEGFQCVCGITSALTVLYNTFPTSKKKNM